MDWVVKILNQYGSISRNYAIQNYCSRLGAVIEKLNKSGWKIEGHYEKNGMGKDYIYSVTKSPYQKVSYTVADGRKIERYEKV